jgi:hypothetical protein
MPPPTGHAATLAPAYSVVFANGIFCADLPAQQHSSMLLHPADTLWQYPMVSPLLRILGAVAGFGSAVLFWFIGNMLAQPVRTGGLLHQDASRYALLAFLFVPALILAVVALFWVPPREAGQGPAEEGKRLRAVLAAVFVVAFLVGIAR